VESLFLVRGYIGHRRDRHFGARVDRKYGCDTRGPIPLERLEIDSPNVEDGVHYEAVSDVYLHRMIRARTISPEKYVFVDLGSGKGRALLIAAAYSFKAFVGVEFSPELHEIAQRNIERFQAHTRSTQQFDLRLGDAMTFEFPLEPIALHLYNPFGERVLREVVGRLETSLREVPRPVVVYYRHPVHRRVFDQAPFLEVVKATSRYAVYSGHER